MTSCDTSSTLRAICVCVYKYMCIRVYRSQLHQGRCRCMDPRLCNIYNPGLLASQLEFFLCSRVRDSMSRWRDSRSTCPPISPPHTRKQLCTRSCSNKHTHTLARPHSALVVAAAVALYHEDKFTYVNTPQDLVIMETIKCTSENVVSTLIKPYFVAFLAANIVNRVPVQPDI